MIYADWLEEHQDLRAELLRMDLELQSEISAEKRQALQRRRQKLLTKVDREWATLLAMSPIEACPAAKQAEQDAEIAMNAPDDSFDEPSEAKVPEAELEFRFRCPKRWENLTPIDENQQTRFCNECQRSVHYCYDIETARQHSQRGNCVALDPSLPRKLHDLEIPYDSGLYEALGTLGMPYSD